jgi:ribosomal protein S18 acetylase RimI-like enzyme
MSAKKFQNIVSRWLVPVSLCLAVAAGGYYWLRVSAEPIFTYDATKDREALITIFKQNMFWLTNETNEDAAVASFKHSIDTNSSSSSWMDRGNLLTYVYRDNEATKGFVSYHKVSSSAAKILYIAIDDTYRRRGYAEKLLKFALADLKKQGYRSVELVTRLVNKRAQGLYRKLGFRQTWDDGTLVGFVCNL